VRARHQPISFGGKIVYCRTSSEVEKAAMDILSKIESIKAPGPVSLGFDLEWRPFPRRGFLFFYLSEFRVPSSICFRRGRPKLTWDESVKRDLKDWNISTEVALDRSAWTLAINVLES